ncbi:hypothetical protein M9458_030478, partial [Cirrhinus mrigala]
MFAGDHLFRDLRFDLGGSVGGDQLDLSAPEAGAPHGQPGQNMINLGTYVVFRINTLAWMTRWLVLNRDLIPLISYTVGSVGLAIMTVMNIVLFYRLMRSDFMKSSREKE